MSAAKVAKNVKQFAAATPRISATFSRDRAGDLDSVARAVFATLNGTEVHVVCKDKFEAQRMRQKVTALCRSRIDMNDWFYVGSRVADGDLFVFLVYITPEYFEAQYVRFSEADKVRMRAEPPLCEMKQRVVSQTIFDGLDAE